MTFGLFSGDKGHHINVWMIIITIKKIKLIWMFASFKSRQNTKSMFVPRAWLFPIILLVCEFDPHKHTWYQKGPVELIKLVKIAHSFLQYVSDQFHVII